MSSAFSDHFSSVASAYAQSRPTYPAALFDWVASQCDGREFAWDCGAGSGQASIELAERFARVIATDASAGQLSRASPHARVEYRVAPAERSGLETDCADLVTVAQALHWFDLERFWPEVRRVARRGAFFAAWTYGPLDVEGDEVDALVQRFRGEMAPWWPEERHHVETGYRDIFFPFPRTDAPSFAIDARWSADRLLGYLRSWSSVVRFQQARGVDPVQALEAPLRSAWGEAARERAIRWPITMMCGYVDAGC